MSIHYNNGPKPKVIKGRVISATEIERKMHTDKLLKIDRFKNWLSQKIELCSPYKSCFSKKKSLNIKLDDAILKSSEKVRKFLSFNHKSSVYCVEQPTINKFNESFDYFRTDIDSTKQDDMVSDMGFELDINNTLKRRNELYTRTSSNQQINSFSSNELDTTNEDLYKDSIKPVITFSNLFGDLNNFQNDHVTESNIDSLSSRLSYDDDFDSLDSNYETFYEKVIICEYITYF